MKETASVKLGLDRILEYPHLIVDTYTETELIKADEKCKWICIKTLERNLNQ